MQRCSELEDYDGETHSLLVTTLMQFLAQPDLAQLSDDKFQSQIQNLVLKHLSLLLGYSPTERAFCVTPQKLRYKQNDVYCLTSDCGLIGSLQVFGDV